MGSPEAVEYPVTVHFHGRVMPRLTSISIDRTRSVRWNGPDLRLHLLADIRDSQIHVEIRSSKYSPELFNVFHQYAFHVCNAAVELMSFALGAGLYIELVDFIGPDGIRQPMGCWTYPDLSRICTAYNLLNDFEQVWEIVQADIHISAALNDLIAAITIPHLSPINCARALEGIRHVISGSKAGSSKQEWAQMREMLRVDEKYLTFVTDLSISHRHGNRVFIDGSKRKIALEYSWEVMNRFLEYKKRANGALPGSEFELLKG